MSGPEGLRTLKSLLGLLYPELHHFPVASVRGDKLLSFSSDDPICLSAWQATVSFVTDGTNVPLQCLSMPPCMFYKPPFLNVLFQKFIK